MTMPLPLKRGNILQSLAQKASRRLARYSAVKSVRMANAEPMVSFTFDDVPYSAYAAGAPILEQGGTRGTFFVSGGLCGTTQPSGLLMSAADCVDLQQRGHEIGCHTFSHAALQGLDRARIDDELARNHAFFKAVSSEIVIENFAYPYGSVSPARKQQVQNHFRSCRGLFSEINVGQADLALLNAVALMDSQIDRAGIDRLVRDCVRRNGWLIFFTHDVQKNASVVGCTPELLSHAVGAARSAGCRIVTVRDALDHLAWSS